MVSAAHFFTRLLVSTVLGLASLATWGAEDTVVKIGLTGPLTGPQAAMGKDNENALRMAMDRLNAQGTVVAGKKLHFELMSEDDAADPRTGMAVAQRFVDAEVKAVLGPYNSGVAIPISKLLNDAGIVMATVASNPKVTQLGYPFVFRIGPNDLTTGARMGVFAARRLKVRSLAVIDDRTAYGQGIADEFIKAAKANGIQIVAREFTTDRATDFAVILTRIKAVSPDGIFYAGYHAQAGPLRRQMKVLGMEGYLLGGDAICNEELAKVGGEAVDGNVYCPQWGGILDQSNEGRQFKTEYKKRFGVEPLTYAGPMYDALFLIVEAMKKANSVEPRQFRSALATISYQGLAGSYRFDEKRDLKDSPIKVYSFKNGQPVAVPDGE
ncbi:branched-chain amino acid ABC transporter substrate-binding protein [Azoarcus sp. KH32C]|uniref:branched-chain amino acid ABC transporter substrate-binding protein n=1 Tax=Azoarcus sp. KH32C TaxID=748247 RepID=UPI0002385BCB|nr:branched-chain amino acid ABC transporter substrate-binding protein [Azoarcus sp. KH32C]BAL27326.1 branched-chain amino acid ABC transporter system, substrate-binding protein [Azoarcus sp. KH32C]